MLKSKTNRQIIQPKLQNYTWFLNTKINLGQPWTLTAQTTKPHLIFEQYDEIEGKPWQLKLPNYIRFWHNMLKSNASLQLIQPKLQNYTWFLNTEVKSWATYSPNSSNYQTTPDFWTVCLISNSSSYQTMLKLEINYKSSNYQTTSYFRALRKIWWLYQNLEIQ